MLCGDDTSDQKYIVWPYLGNISSSQGRQSKIDDVEILPIRSSFVLGRGVRGVREGFVYLVSSLNLLSCSLQSLLNVFNMRQIGRNVIRTPKETQSGKFLSIIHSQRTNTHFLFFILLFYPSQEIEKHVLPKI